MFDPNIFLSERDANDAEGNGQSFLPDLQQFFMANMPFDTDNVDFQKREDMMETMFPPRQDLDPFDPSVFFSFDPSFLAPDAQDIHRFISQPFEFFPMVNSDNSAREKPENIKFENQLLPKPQIMYSKTAKIGTLTIEERHLKIEKYLEKRKRRNFCKKISYECRKRVADDRIRIRGRFVSKIQAEALRGLENDKNNVQLPIKKES
ncbi:unnamed protein product [Blepharisma stoltei]|uniref:CCT domain-containing protein n=1 Tax=Blepharisma stoltei TaxID=1481888 RepID=A0AAU9IU26_9CILI|nr:unnamed protein product [Blepharisma stoltei]